MCYSLNLNHYEIMYLSALILSIFIDSNLERMSLQTDSFISSVSNAIKIIIHGFSKCITKISKRIWEFWILRKRVFSRLNIEQVWVLTHRRSFILGFDIYDRNLMGISYLSCWPREIFPVIDTLSSRRAPLTYTYISHIGL